MIYKTHHVAGLVAAELVLFHYHQPILTWQTLASLVGAYLAGPAADVDQPHSFVGSKVKPVSLFLQGIGIRHRTLTHSILFMVFFWLMLLAIPLPDVVRWAILAGYVSHPIIDLFNEEGVELLWPLKFRIKLLPSVIAIRVESPGELLFRLGCTIGSYGLLFLYVAPLFVGWPVVGPLVSHVVSLYPSGLVAALH